MTVVPGVLKRYTLSRSSSSAGKRRRLHGSRTAREDGAHCGARPPVHFQVCSHPATHA